MFGVQKVNGDQDICSRDASVGNGKNFQKQARSEGILFKVYIAFFLKFTLCTCNRIISYLKLI